MDQESQTMDVKLTGAHDRSVQTASWPSQIFTILKQFDVRQVPYVPDAGHAELIRSVHADKDMRAITLTTEEEGVALTVGAWLGGQRSALLMQSSGVGTCVNMLSLVKSTRTPFFTLVTMRGEWGEFNPWQVPMGAATPKAFRMMGLQVLRANTADEVADVVSAGATMTYLGGTSTAVLLSQRLIGAKIFAK
jgi:sulfopyruvate decarboxylase TPP-binding subunit